MPRRSCAASTATSTVLREITELFLDHSPKALERMRRAIAADDAPALEYEAHAFKGSVGVLFARPTLEAVTALERIGRDGDLAHAEQACAALERELSRLGPALASLAAGGHAVKILVVEDDVIVRRVLRGHLESCGHEVTQALDGTEAWELLQQGHFPVVISDWMMPGIDGLELIRRIRSSHQPGYVYVILLTGKSQREDFVQGDGGRRRRLRDQALRPRRAAGPPALRRADHPARTEPGRPQRRAAVAQRRAVDGQRAHEARPRRRGEGPAGPAPDGAPGRPRGPLRLGLQAVRGAGRRHPQRRPARRPPRRPLRPRRQRPRRRLGPAVGDGQPLPVDGARLLVAALEEGRGGVRLHPRAGRRGRRAVESTLPVQRRDRAIFHDGLRHPRPGEPPVPVHLGGASPPGPRPGRRPGDDPRGARVPHRHHDRRLRGAHRLPRAGRSALSLLRRDHRGEGRPPAALRHARPGRFPRRGAGHPPRTGPSPICWGPSSGGPAPTASTTTSRSWPWRSRPPATAEVTLRHVPSVAGRSTRGRLDRAIRTTRRRSPPGFGFPRSPLLSSATEVRLETSRVFAYDVEESGGESTPLPAPSQPPPLSQTAVSPAGSGNLRRRRPDPCAS